MTERKTVSRNVVIALGIISVVLAVGLVGAIADYTLIVSEKDNIITAKDSEIASLNSQMANKDSRISDLQNQLNELNSTVNDLNSTVNDLNDIVKLEKYAYWGSEQDIKQNADSYITWSTKASYAGYVRVHVESNNTNTYVRVIYSSHGVNYDNQIGVGINGTAVFPILPTSYIQVRVGNTDLSNGASTNVEIIHYY